MSLDDLLSAGADAIFLSRRQLPQAATDDSDWQIASDQLDDHHGYSIIHNLTDESVKNTPSEVTQVLNLQEEVDGIIKLLLSDAPNNDRDGTLTKVFGTFSRLHPMDPNTHGLWSRLNNAIIHMLYHTVPNPIKTQLGPSFQFRQADGGGNNPQLPDVGRAGMPYARSAQGSRALPTTSLPDPGLVFDTILKRRGFTVHPGGMSSLIFAYASIVTHSLFRTNRRNMWQNDASSYLDLSPLYGDNATDLERVRDKSKGLGLLYPDTFSDERFVLLPPVASVLLVIFNRNHNFVAEKILKINERKRWRDPPPADEQERAIQDEEIFQTARLINCAHFISTVSRDYAAGFLGSSEGANPALDPFSRMRGGEMPVERGRGNHLSVEFNAMYRFHSTLSERDEKWTEDFFRDLFPNIPCDQIGLEQLRQLGKIVEDIKTEAPQQRALKNFGEKLERGPDGKFSDDDLAGILFDSIEDPAAAFRGQGTPNCLRSIEIMGIQQSRAWGLCTMNEFRQSLGLKRFQSFEEWNPNPAIAEAARRLYGHVDYLELYTGLQAEATMPLSDSLRLASGYTMTRGILGDAIALVRGDRFYTIDFTPSNLTAWGFHDVRPVLNNGARGAHLPKLLLRHLPRHFPWNSVYSLFPFCTPAHMKQTLTGQGIADLYTFERPVPVPLPKVLNTFTAINYVLRDSLRFNVRYTTQGHPSILFLDDPDRHAADRAMVMHAVFPKGKESLDEHFRWMAGAFKQMIEERSWVHDGVPGRFVDIIKDVINVAYIRFAAERLLSIPLKTAENESGIFTESELFDFFTIFYDNTFEFTKPDNAFAVFASAATGAQIVSSITANALLQFAPELAPEGFAPNPELPAPNQESYSFLRALANAGSPLPRLLSNAVGLALGGSVTPALAAAKVIDFYLDDARNGERNHIIKLVQSNDEESEALLRGYVLEAMRLNPQFPGVWRVAAADAVVDQGHGLQPIEIKEGDQIWASFRNAHLNPEEFPDPTTVNPERPVDSYFVNGSGFHRCPGAELAQLAIVELLKVVFQLKNVRRAPGHAGKLVGISQITNDTKTDWFVQRSGALATWAGSLVLVYDP